MSHEEKRMMTKACALCQKCQKQEEEKHEEQILRSDQNRVAGNISWNIHERLDRVEDRKEEIQNEWEERNTFAIALSEIHQYLPAI